MSCANISATSERCLDTCEGSCPSFGALGDVRYCGCGFIWMCWRSGYHSRWDRLSPFWNPVQYRRAVRALAELTVGDE